MKNVVDSFLKQTFEALEKFDFSKVLRDLTSPPQTQSNERKYAQKRQPTEGDHWSSKDLNQHLHRLSQTGLRLTELPKTIDLAGLATVMTRLSDKAKDGREHGRIGYTRMHDRRLEMSETFSGSENSVKMEVQYVPFGARIPTVMMHTHPYIYGRATPAYHFSKEDFVSFLQVEPIQISIVLAPHLTLLALKSAQTPAHSEKLESNIDSWLEKSSRDYATTQDRRIMRFTKYTCQQLNIGLYRIKHSEDGTIAKRVI
jgi:hypothetical protein